MNLYSTRNTNNIVGLKEAVLKGLPSDNGLFMPMHIPQLSADFFASLSKKPFQEIAFRISRALLSESIAEEDIHTIIKNAITFPAPLVALNEQQHILELFHGPSLAFKDFGARFMAQLMSHFNRGEDRELVILVATSGDTGGAVASGFYQTPGIKVVILYPSGKVSHLQEQQLTTLGHNITALEVDGTFDDCQALVKKAFLDEGLNQQIRLSSANSINIARLIPQSFYYFEAFKQLESPLSKVVFSIPSGNFGNLTAGLLAKRMGLPIHQFIAATNINDVVPAYLASGNYESKPSVRTISNAMDVGNPSNFARMRNLYESNDPNSLEGFTWNNMKQDIVGYSFDDFSTRNAIKTVFDQYQYIIDPHGAVGFLALDAYQKAFPDTTGIILETAHPSKFIDEVEHILEQKIEIPERLASLANKTKEAVAMSADFESFKSWLSAHY